MSQDPGRSSRPTARYDSDEAEGLLPGKGAKRPDPDYDEDEDLAVEAGAFGSGPVIDGSRARESDVLPQTGDSDALVVDRDALTITDHKALKAPPADPNDLTRAAPEATRRLGSFDLERKVGQGGMGEVWLARQRSLDRLVAVKVLPRSLASQESFLERFQREARAAASLKHPHVIQVYEFGIEDGTPYFAMEYIEGEDLQQVMRRERYVNLRTAVEVVRDVASALEAAHAKGIIHRDIKPSNVMIDRDGIVKVMDFGLAKASTNEDGNLTNAGLIMGTPNYLSPEQGRGDPLDARSDLYSLGVVFYELMAGKLPFRADTPAGLIFKHVYEPPPPLLEQRPDLPPFLVDVCERLLTKDRDERYPSAAEVLADLDEFLDNAPYYMDGGARRPGSGSENPMRVASGRASAVRRAARRRHDSDRSKAAEASGALRESVTEELEQSDFEPEVELQVQADEDSDDQVVFEDTDDEVEVPRRVLDESSGSYPTPDELPRPLHSGERLRERVRSQESTRREQRPEAPAKRSKTALWVLLAAAVLAVLGLRFGAPLATAGFLHRQTPGLAQQLASLGVLPADPRERPLPATQLVFTTPALGELPAGAGAALVRVQPGAEGEAPQEQVYPLRAGELNAFPPGSYLLRFSRKGYVMDQEVELVAFASDVPASGKLKDAAGGDPFARELSWAPSSALLASYRRGRELLQAGRSADAAEVLGEAAALDPEFQEEGQPTVAALLAQAHGGEPPELPPTTPVDPPQAVDPADAASVEAKLVAMQAALETKQWRAVQESVRALETAGVDPERYGSLSAEASEALKEAETKAQDFTLKLEDGALDAAASALAELELLDPERPDLAALAATLERTRKRRELAFADEDISLEERKQRLDAYIELAPHDEKANLRLREAKTELARLAELRALEQELRELEAAKDWTAALEKARALALFDQGNAVAAEVAARAQLELDRDAILLEVQSLDGTLTGDDPEAIVALFANNPTERRAWKDFLAFDGRFTASAHEIDRGAITVQGDQAVLEGVWSFTVKILDQDPQDLERAQRITLVRADAGWTFRSFEVLE